MGILALGGLADASVQQFCEEHNLLAPLESALQLAEEVFAPVGQARVEVETDPETEDRTLVIEISTTLGVDEAVRRKREYTRRWVEQSSPAVREKIRLVFDLIPQ